MKTKTKRPTTATELRDDLLEIFAQLRSGKIEEKTARQMNASAREAIRSAAVEMKYAEANQRKPTIPFLET